MSFPLPDKTNQFYCGGFKICINDFGQSYKFDNKDFDKFKFPSKFTHKCCLSFFCLTEKLPSIGLSKLDDDFLKSHLKDLVVREQAIELEVKSKTFYCGLYSCYAFSEIKSELRVFFYYTRAPYLKLSVPMMHLISNVGALSEGLLLHGAGGIIEDKAFAILGLPEAGKSTSISMIKHDFLLSDDVLIVRFENGTPMLYSTPMGPNTDGPNSAPLGAIFFPVKSEKFELKRLSKVQALEIYYSAQSGYWNQVFKPFRDNQFRMVSRLFSLVPAYEMHFPKNFVDNEQIKKALNFATF